MVRVNVHVFIFTVSSVIYLSDISLTTLETSTPGEIILMSREEILETAVQLSTLLKHEFIAVPVRKTFFPCFA
jgi:hypothetical protein